MPLARIWNGSAWVELTGVVPEDPQITVSNSSPVGPQFGDLWLNPDENSTGYLTQAAGDAAYAAKVATNAAIARVDPGSSLTEGQIIQGASGGGPSRVKHRSHRSVTIAAADSPAWQKAMADYICDGTADEVQWQAAIDEAETYPGGDAIGIPEILVLPGAYRFAAGIIQKSAPIRGASLVNAGARVYWDGASGSGTAVTSSTNNSFNNISHINFRPGTAEPNIWIDLSGLGVDKFYQLDHLHFVGGNVQIKVGRWWNAHWSHLRFDHWHDYALLLTPPAGQNASSFIIENFTCDHHPATGTGGRGFVGIDGTAANAFVGSVKLANGRIEINEPYLSHKAIFDVTVGATVRFVDVALENVTYSDATGATDDVAVYLTSGTDTNVLAMFDNFFPTNLSAYFGGNFRTSSVTPPIQNGGVLSVAHVVGSSADVTSTHVRAIPDNFAGTVGYSLRQPADTADRMQVTNVGDILRSRRNGTATATPDVGLYVGSGAPTHTAANGSLYQRTDGSGTTDNLYIRRGGAWVGIA